jgi:hypothetical protein
VNSRPKSVTVLLLALLLTLPITSESPSISGAWLQSEVKWNKPPAELHLKQQYAESAVLYFGVNHKFALVYGTVIRSANSEGLSHGDGRVVYLGKWEIVSGTVRVTYHLVSRTVRIANEALPGPTQMRELENTNGTLVFNAMQFHRESGLDQDMRATVDGEYARSRSNPPD